MNENPLDIKNERKHYLHEKELFILFTLLSDKHISTHWSNLFNPENTANIYVPEGIGSSDEKLKLFEEEISRTVQRLKSKEQSSIVLSYLLRITKDVYDKKHQEHQDQLQALEIEMSEHRKADCDYQTTVATVVSVARRAKDIFEQSSEPAEKRAFLSYLLQNPVVDGKNLYFTLVSPFNLVLELADTPNWCSR